MVLFLRLLIVFIPLVIGFVVYFLIGLVPTFILKIFGEKVSDRYLFFHCRRISNFLMYLFGVKAHITDNSTEVNGPVCYISNHTSLLDIPLIAGPCKIKTGFISKGILAFVFPLNLAIIAMHGVFMNRKNLKSSVKSIRHSEKIVQKGHPILIFPEGTRSKTGEIGTFKRGSFRLASDINAQIVPIVVKGIRNACENRKTVFGKTHCYVYIGRPIGTSLLTDRTALNNMVDNVEKNVRIIYNGLGRKNDGR